MRPSYPDRVEAQAYQVNMVQARACDRTNLRELEEACQWLSTQASKHQDAKELLDELRPIRDALTEALLRKPDGEPSVIEQQLKDAIEGRHKAEAELLKLETSQLREDMAREIEHRNRLELALIYTAGEILANDKLISDIAEVVEARLFLVARFKEYRDQGITKETTDELRSQNVPG